MTDPDLIPGTQTLRNLRSLTDPERLAEFEAIKTSRRMNQLQSDPIKGSFDFAHLKETHRRIFQDVYPFAGQPRSTPIRKAEQVLSGGSVDYEHPQQVASKTEAHLSKMNGRDWSALQSRADPATIGVFAQDVAELWRLHPFREGNTRTTMNFVGQFAKERGFPLDQDLLKDNADFVRKALVMATYDQPEHIARILEDSRQRKIDAGQNEHKHSDATESTSERLEQLRATGRKRAQEKYSQPPESRSVKKTTRTGYDYEP